MLAKTLYLELILSGSQTEEYSAVLVAGDHLAVRQVCLGLFHDPTGQKQI